MTAVHRAGSDPGVFPAGHRLLQGVNILHQSGTVIEGFRPGKGVIRDNAFVNIVEGTVQYSRQLLGTGNREHCAGSGCAGQHRAGAAAGEDRFLLPGYKPPFPPRTRKREASGKQEGTP